MAGANFQENKNIVTAILQYNYLLSLFVESLHPKQGQEQVPRHSYFF
jgi:hypothetical protein